MINGCKITDNVPNKYISAAWKSQHHDYKRII